MAPWGILHEGDWKCDKREGFGKATLENGDSYEGE